MEYGLSKEVVKDYWEQRALRQGELVVGYGGHKKIQEQDQEYKVKIDFVKPILNPNLQTLDYGCGIGRWSSLFRKQYLGVDITERVLDFARKRNPNKKYLQLKNPFITLSDVEITKFLENTEQFFTSTCLQHCSDDLVYQVLLSVKKYAKKKMNLVFYEASNIGGVNHCKGRSFSDYLEVVSNIWGDVESSKTLQHIVHGQPHSVHKIVVKNV
jgi:SAM-dependent methyltransferase